MIKWHHTLKMQTRKVLLDKQATLQREWNKVTDYRNEFQKPLI